MLSKRNKVSSYRIWPWAGIVFGGLLAGFLIVTACSTSTNSGSGSGMGSVNVMLSDPATCAAPAGPFSHVYVTITDVQDRKSVV